MKTKTPYQFFLKTAGYCHDPKTETPMQGRRRCARGLAHAERQACAVGYTFEWQHDLNSDSSEFNDEKPPYRLWECYCRNAFGVGVASLHGIDFGRDQSPWGQPYARVVQAELASEGLAVEAKKN